MTPDDLLFVGTAGHVVAIKKRNGRTVWERDLKSGIFTAGDGFVTLLVEDGMVYAHTRGELFCLDAATGDVLWTNKLDGLGYSLASLVTSRSGSSSPDAIARRRRQQEGDRDQAGTHAT